MAIENQPKNLEEFKQLINTDKLVSISLKFLDQEGCKKTIC